MCVWIIVLDNHDFGFLTLRFLVHTLLLWHELQIIFWFGCKQNAIIRVVYIWNDKGWWILSTHRTLHYSALLVRQGSLAHILSVLHVQLPQTVYWITLVRSQHPALAQVCRTNASVCFRLGARWILREQLILMHREDKSRIYAQYLNASPALLPFRMLVNTILLKMCVIVTNIF